MNGKIKSAIEWVMERQSVTTHKDSGIVNDANDRAIETMQNAKYPLELLCRVITVSMETLKIITKIGDLGGNMELTQVTLRKPNGDEYRMDAIRPLAGVLFTCSGIVEAGDILVEWGEKIVGYSSEKAVWLVEKCPVPVKTAQTQQNIQITGNGNIVNQGNYNNITVTQADQAIHGLREILLKAAGDNKEQQKEITELLEGLQSEIQSAQPKKSLIKSLLGILENTAITLGCIEKVMPHIQKLLAYVIS